MDKKEPYTDTFHPDAILPDGGVLGRRRRGNEESLILLKPVSADAHPADEDEIVRLRCSSNKGEMKVESLGKAGKGPAKYATRSYRTNYDSIFGAKQPHAVN